LEFRIEPGEKFALLVSDLYPTQELDRPWKLDEHTWFLPKIPIELTEHWKQWLGSIISEKIEKSNFALIIKQHSDKPDEIDSINQSLRQRIFNLFYCIIFQGIPSAQNIYVLTGANVNNKYDIQNYSSEEKLYPIHDVKLGVVTPSKLLYATTMNQQYESISSSKETFRRLRLGFHSLVKAMREQFIDFRLHDYVRAIEALVKPKWGEIRRGFVNRCQTFVKVCDETRQILNEIYLMRSTNEHLNKWLDPLEDKYENPEKIGFERLWQVENLALSAYSKLLSDSNLFHIFETDDNIDSFWAKSDEERRAIWGKPLDIRRFKWIDKDHGPNELGDLALK
jgi:hypothetical protein